MNSIVGTLPCSLRSFLRFCRKSPAEFNGTLVAARHVPQTLMLEGQFLMSVLGRKQTFGDLDGAELFRIALRLLRIMGG